MSAPLVPRVIAASVQIRWAVSLVIVLAPGTNCTHGKLVNTVKQNNITFTLKHIQKMDFARNIIMLNS